MMATIKNFKILNNKNIHFNFSDDSEKTIDFSDFIEDDKLSQPLRDSVYFKQVRVYENGRGIFWPNGFDFCPDFLLEYKTNSQKEIAH